MKINIALQHDIEKLKLNRKLKDKTEYLKSKKLIAAKYNVTLRTVENWLNKDNAGVRKTRDDAGKPRAEITDAEVKMTGELLTSGTEIQKIKKTIMEKTKKKVSDRKLNHIRDRAEEVMTSPEPPSKGDLKETSFGDQAKELFEKLFELDLIAPNYGIMIKVGDKDIIIPKYYLETICMILADAYNYVENKYKIDPEQLVRKRLFHLIEQHVRIAETEMSSTEDIKDLVKMYNDLLEKVKLDADLHVVEKICQELRAGITYSEIVALIEKHSPKDD